MILKEIKRAIKVFTADNKIEKVKTGTKILTQFGKIETVQTINKDKILEIMHHSSLYNVKKNSTIYRRYSTVYRWTQEIMHVIED